MLRGFTFENQEQMFIISISFKLSPKFAYTQFTDPTLVFEKGSRFFS